MLHIEKSFAHGAAGIPSTMGDAVFSLQIGEENTFDVAEEEEKEEVKEEERPE